MQQAVTLVLIRLEAILKVEMSKATAVDWCEVDINQGMQNMYINEKHLHSLQQINEQIQKDGYAYLEFSN